MKPAFSLLTPLLAPVTLAWAIPAEAASHREAPLIALDPSADNTDVYALSATTRRTWDGWPPIGALRSY
jgi:hypothetical protein